MIAATRRPSRSTAVHARPEPGSGSSTGRPCSSTNALAVGQPVGDRDAAVAEALGQQLAHRPGRRRARREHRVGDRAQHAVERSSVAMVSAAAGTREREHHDAEPRPERPRPDVVDVRRRRRALERRAGARPPAARPGASATTSSADGQQRPEQELGAIRHSAAVGEQVSDRRRHGRPSAARRRDRRDLRVEPAVRGARGRAAQPRGTRRGRPAPAAARSPITLSAAPTSSSSTAGSASSGDGQRRDEVGDGMAGARTAGGRARARRSPAAPPPHVARCRSAPARVRRVGAARDAAHDVAPRGALRVEVVAARRHDGADRARCRCAATSAAARTPAASVMSPLPARASSEKPQ